MSARRRRLTPGAIAAFVVALAFALVWLVPFAWALATALKPDKETTATPVSWFGSTVTLDAFDSVLSSGDIWRWYFNSALVSIVVTLLTVILGSMAAFAFSRVRFRGPEHLYFLIGAGLIVPFQALIVPLLEELQTFGMVDTYWGIILPQIAAPIAVLVFKRFFDGIPKDLEDSARLDGASTWRIYSQIWMPLSKPATAAVAIFTFVTSWNNFLWPFIITSAGALQTVPVGLATVQSFYGAQYAQVMALSPPRGAAAPRRLPAVPAPDRRGHLEHRPQGLTPSGGARAPCCRPAHGARELAGSFAG